MFSTIMGIVFANILFLALHLESRILPDPLSPKQEKEEFQKYFSGDMQARDTLIKHNLRLVAHVVKKYYQSPIEKEDLMSIGKTGTAQTGRYNEDGSEILTAWFCGFYPYENPEYTICITMYNGGESTRTAAPVFKKICDSLYYLI